MGPEIGHRFLGPVTKYTCSVNSDLNNIGVAHQNLSWKCHQHSSYHGRSHEPSKTNPKAINNGFLNSVLPTICLLLTNYFCNIVQTTSSLYSPEEPACRGGDLQYSIIISILFLLHFLTLYCMQRTLTLAKYYTIKIQIFEYVQ